MITTLTLNPSVDRTIELPVMLRGEVNRAAQHHLDPGGKGVNVARALVRNAVDTTAVVVRGGMTGEQFERLLRAEGVPAAIVDAASETRSNITIVEADGAVTKLNEPGGPLTPHELDAVVDAVLAQVTAGAPGEWAVLCGSLPPGAPVDTYARLTTRLAAVGARVAVDTSGPALRSAVQAGPALIKPNHEELEELVGRGLASLRDVVEAARELVDGGVGAVLASLGADGAVLVGHGVVVAGGAPVERPRSTVGAGDALLAGFLAGTLASGDGRGGDGRGGDRVGRNGDADATVGGDGGVAALAEGLAWSAAAVGLSGSRMAGPGDLRRDLVRVDHAPDLDRPLAGSAPPVPA